MENVEVRGRGHSELVWNGAVYRLVRDRLASAAQLWRERTAR